MRISILMEALRIGFFTGLIIMAAYAGYDHGLAVGLVQAETNIGTTLYKCVEILGGKIKKGP